MKVAEVVRADLAKLHLSMRERPYQANRTLEVISKMFNLAEEWGYRAEGTNPRKGIKKYPEQKRERFLALQVRYRTLCKALPSIALRDPSIAFLTGHGSLLPRRRGRRGNEGGSISKD